MTRQGLRSLLALAALAACSGPPAPATTPTSTPPTTPTPADDSAGFADPKTSAEPPPAEPAKPGGPPDPELVARIQQSFGDNCRYERACGELIGIDCGAAVDGPYYYVQKSDLKKVSTCGGACRGGCTDCPPKAWTCPVY